MHRYSPEFTHAACLPSTKTTGAAAACVAGVGEGVGVSALARHKCASCVGMLQRPMGRASGCSHAHGLACRTDCMEAGGQCKWHGRHTLTLGVDVLGSFTAWGVGGGEEREECGGARTAASCSLCCCTAATAAAAHCTTVARRATPPVHHMSATPPSACKRMCPRTLSLPPLHALPISADWRVDGWVTHGGTTGCKKNSNWTCAPAS